MADKAPRIGILGGTFDPVHLGHLIIAEAVREGLGLDRVIFLPAGQPWMKADRPITPPHHRRAMVELAIASNPHFGLSSLEIERPGPTYSVETLRELQRTVGSRAGLYFIVGRDALSDLPKWKEPRAILEMCRLVGVGRPGGRGFDPRALEGALPGASGRILLFDAPLIEISATDIRRRVAEGRSIRYLVPETVARYIAEHGLYRQERAREGSES